MQKKKLSEKLARSIIIYVVDRLSGYSKEFQQIVFEKLLGHSLVKGMLPSYCSDISTMKHNQEVVENLKNGLSTILLANTTPNLLLQKILFAH
jgi:hypothetical protein